MIDELAGLGTALVTPFKADSTIDEAALRRLVSLQIEGGVDYLVVLGTTGEKTTLSDDEQQRVQKIICDAISVLTKPIPLVLGIGGNDTQRVICYIEANRDFLQTHYKAILSVCPYYNRPSQEGLFRHFSAIAETSPIPVLLYNVPTRTGVSLDPITVKRLWEAYPNKIIGIKEASGNILNFRDLIAYRAQLQSVKPLIICGDDGLAAQAMQMGADGLISVASNVWPSAFKTIVHNKDWLLQTHFHEVIELLFREGNPTGVKAILAQKGLIENVLRLPLTSCSAELWQLMGDMLGSNPYL